jgi:hypothetical protein
VQLQFGHLQVVGNDVEKSLVGLILETVKREIILVQIPLKDLHHCFMIVCNAVRILMVELRK